MLVQDLLRNLHEGEAIKEAPRQIDYKLQLLLHGKPNEKLGLPSAKRLRTEYERTHEIFL